MGQKVSRTSIESIDGVVYGVNRGNRKEVATGIYFYSAHVRFDTTDPSKREHQMKGWIKGGALNFFRALFENSFTFVTHTELRVMRLNIFYGSKTRSPE